MPTASRLGALLVPALLLAGCVRTGPKDAVALKGPDGKEYLLLDRGQYKGLYDKFGRLERIEYDSNGDGKADNVAHHNGDKSPRLLEVDEDFNGQMDRWEDYDPSGRLVKVGLSRKHNGIPDLWITPGPSDLPAKKEYDQNADMRVDRTEFLERGLISRVELDTNDDGRPDRWQDWTSGRLTTEDLDTDADGKADRRLVYNDKGRILKLEPIRGE